MITLGQEQKLRIEMRRKKLKKALLVLLSSTLLSSILHRFARGCFKSIQSHTIKKEDGSGNTILKQ